MDLTVGWTTSIESYWLKVDLEWEGEKNGEKESDVVLILNRSLVASTLFSTNSSTQLQIPKTATAIILSSWKNKERRGKKNVHPDSITSGILPPRRLPPPTSRRTQACRPSWVSKVDGRSKILATRKGKMDAIRRDQHQGRATVNAHRELCRLSRGLQKIGLWRGLGWYFRSAGRRSMSTNTLDLTV